MMEWFTVEKIDEFTYVISEYEHYEQVHSYLLLGSEKALLIDTGLGVSDISEIVRTITQLEVEVVTTHIHWDHIGGHKYFDNINVFVDEKNWLSDFPLKLEQVKSNLTAHDTKLPKGFDLDSYKLHPMNPTNTLEDNDFLDIGDRKLIVVHTPGHSPGHICLFEEETGYLFTGDLIYKGKLDMFYPTTDPILFRNSIDRIKKLNVKKILPAHFELDVDTKIINDISAAFDTLSKKKLLFQGSGLHEFDGFLLHM